MFLSPSSLQLEILMSPTKCQAGEYNVIYEEIQNIDAELTRKNTIQ